MPNQDTLSHADGRWPEILAALGGLSADQLTNKPQPCPHCGGKDRYRFDDLNGTGSWFCNQCGGKDRSGGGGSGIDLLMRVRDWTFKDAAEHVQRHLRIDLPAAAPAPTAPPPSAAPPNLGNASSQYPYTDAHGNQLFWIQRYDRDDGGKFFVHRTWINGKWHYPKKADGFDSSWPTPRPLYRLHCLSRQPYADVLIVEGEKAADHAVTLLPDFAVVSWPNGSNAIDKIDWAPLKGRFVALWPDNDDPGRKAMNRIAAKLIALGCTVQVIAPPPDAPPGWDIADAVWTPEEAVDHVLGNRSPFAPSKPGKQPPPPDPDPVDQAMPEPFDCLGFREDDYYYLPRSTGRVTRLSAAGHTSTNLLRMAVKAYWETAYPGRGGISWQDVISDLYAKQHAVGDFDPDRLRGRGAWRDKNRTVLHLGNRLLVDGIEQPINIRLQGTRYHYQRSSGLAPLVGLQPLSDEDSIQVLALCERFYWEMPASALLLAGWCLLAPVCGVLPWRPHIWLTAGAGTGKTAVMEKFVGALLGDMHLNTQGSSTEAFIRQHLKTDALPVVMDEAESNQPNDKARMQQILSLARQASSETRAIQGRGSPSGETQIYRIRSMFLLASIATAVKNGADDRRFTQITLRKPPNVDPAEEAARWVQFKTDLKNTLTEEFCQRFLLRTVSIIPNIRESIAVFSEIAAGHFGTQAAGDQYGTLLAGAWHVSVSRPATPDDARSMIRQANWQTYLDNDNVLPDEDACLQTILQHHLRVQNSDRGAVDRTILELIGICDHPSLMDPNSPVSERDAIATLGREGIRVHEGRLLIGNTAQGIRKILSDTNWSTNWSTILSRLPGAEKGVLSWFSGAGTMRAVSLPVPPSS